MCGFFAAMTRDRLESGRIDQALLQLRHRGPDDSGIWQSADQRWSIGHTRLSIVGLDNGHQPVHSSDDQVHMVVNGEFYDYHRVYAELHASGAKFTTDSDSEIALHLYLQSGAQAAHQLYGEFSVLIADQKQDMMLAIRDRFGIKPLFYSIIDGNVFFASEIKALLALGVPAVWDAESLYGEAFWVRPNENTLFAHIHAVPPGCYAIAKRGQIRIYPYWDWQFPTHTALQQDDRSFTEICENFREILARSIKKRIVADVEVGCYLSGGIDSCAIASFAQHEMSRPLSTFTVGFEESTHNESDIAAAQARAIGADHQIITVTRQDIADAFSEAVWHAENMLTNGNAVAKFLLSRCVKRSGIKAVLTGEGADEILGGYLPFRRDAILHDQTLSEAQKAALLADMYRTNVATRAIFMQNQPQSPVFDPVSDRLGWLPSFYASYGALGLRLLPFLRDDFTQRIRQINPFTLLFDRLSITCSDFSQYDRFNQALYLNARTFLPNQILTFLGDRMEMAHSVEGRLPFLDHELAEFAAAIPIQMKTNQLCEKYILREASKDRVIPEVYRRQKQPFAAPPIRHKKDPVINFYYDILTSVAAEQQPVFNPEKALATLDHISEFPQDQLIAVESNIQFMVCAAIMQEQFNISDII